MTGTVRFLCRTLASGLLIGLLASMPVRAGLLKVGFEALYPGSAGAIGITGDKLFSGTLIYDLDNRRTDVDEQAFALVSGSVMVNGVEFAALPGAANSELLYLDRLGGRVAAQATFDFSIDVVQVFYIGIIFFDVAFDPGAVPFDPTSTAYLTRFFSVRYQGATCDPDFGCGIGLSDDFSVSVEFVDVSEPPMVALMLALPAWIAIRRRRWRATPWTEKTGSGDRQAG
ncbi:MAG: hypothetical protein KDI82_00850 [Gammaproteobacteria bacterium]|nr:hypothetical protein [Gammaproteobacteria bacterium]